MNPAERALLLAVAAVAMHTNPHLQQLMTSAIGKPARAVAGKPAAKKPAKPAARAKK